MNWGNIIKKIVLILVFIFIANLVSSFFLGFLLAWGGNFQIIGLSSIAFDPLITIAYILLYYFITLFYQPSPKAQFYLFLLTIFMSFVVNFIQGTIFLIVFYFLLRKLKII